MATTSISYKRFGLWKATIRSASKPKQTRQLTPDRLVYDQAQNRRHSVTPTTNPSIKLSTYQTRTLQQTHLYPRSPRPPRLCQTSRAIRCCRPPRAMRHCRSSQTTPRYRPPRTLPRWRPPRAIGHSRPPRTMPRCRPPRAIRHSQPRTHPNSQTHTHPTRTHIHIITNHWKHTKMPAHNRGHCAYASHDGLCGTAAYRELCSAAAHGEICGAAAHRKQWRASSS